MTTWSVVIACHTEDRWDSLNAAIDSALDQTEPPPEVIVVVDHNPALLQRIANKLAHAVIPVANREEKGLSGCRNTGTAIASGELVAFLDDDARAEDDWLSSLEKSLLSANVVGVGGMAIPEWDTGFKPAWLPEEYLWVVGCHYLGHRTDAGPIRSPIGANMAYSRSDIIEAGGFSPVFSSEPFNRCDDTEFAIRIKRQTGRDVHFVPDAVVHHRVSYDRTKWTYFVRRCLLEGRAKAALASATGLASSTGTERSYVRKTLGPGALRHIANGFRGDLAEFAVALNLLIGLFITSLGFAQGSILIGRVEKQPAPLVVPASRSL